MPMLNKRLLRADIKKLYMKSQKIITKGALDFVARDENKDFDLIKTLLVIAEGNKKFYELLSTEGGKTEDLYDVINRDQMKMLARIFRYAMEYKGELRLEQHPLSPDIKIEEIIADGVPAEWQISPEIDEDKVLLYFHGGGQVLGSPKSSRPYCVAIGKAAGVKVLSIDYALAPENPYPAGLNDCVTSYKWLLSTGVKPENIVLGGASAGGNMVLSTLLRIRDDSLPIPKGAVLLSPGIDYTTENKTVLTNAPTDPVMADAGMFWWIPAYLNGQDPSNPYISPVHADLKGLPPILIQVSTCEMVYDHSTRLAERAKAAGVNAILQEWDDMPHVWHNYGFYDLREAKEAIDKIGEFIKSL
jgi:acetyl esterase/lipase